MSYKVRAASILTAVLAMGSISCSAATPDGDDEELVGEAEVIGSSEAGVSGAIDVGTELIATANVNLRSNASTSSSILHVVPDGAKVVVVASSPEGGFYKVKHDGTVGWSFGQYYEVGDTGGTTDPPSSAREAAMARAKAGKGFSYWWGHGRFREEGPTSSTKGSCSGSCPSCSHKGSYGGDCSGYVAKVWQVPESNEALDDDSHPYSTASFDDDSGLWKTVNRTSMKTADAMVYRSGGAGHIFVYEMGDAWGSLYAYECKGCSYGCIAGYRTASSAYHGIRRSGF